MRVDVSTVVELRRDADRSVDPFPSVNDFVIRAVALALRERPDLNRSFVDGRIERHGRINVGVAVATLDSLLVPAVMGRRPTLARRDSRRGARPGRTREDAPRVP